MPRRNSCYLRVAYPSPLSLDICICAAVRCSLPSPSIDNNGYPQRITAAVKRCRSSFEVLSRTDTHTSYLTVPGF